MKDICSKKSCPERGFFFKIQSHLLSCAEIRWLSHNMAQKWVALVMKPILLSQPILPTSFPSWDHLRKIVSSVQAEYPLKTIIIVASGCKDFNKCLFLQFSSPYHGEAQFVPLCMRKTDSTFNFVLKTLDQTSGEHECGYLIWKMWCYYMDFSLK